jgi:hypothetical protein
LIGKNDSSLNKIHKGGVNFTLEERKPKFDFLSNEVKLKMSKIRIVEVISAVGILSFLLGLIAYSNMAESYKSISVFILAFAIVGLITLLIDLLVEIYKERKKMNTNFLPNFFRTNKSLLAGKSQNAPKKGFLVT